MAGKYNTWIRTTLADRIRSNGGYRDRSAGGPLAWTVPYYTSRDMEDTQKVLAKLVENHFSCMADMMLQHPNIDADVEQLVSADNRDMWEWAQEMLVDDLDNDEGMRMWSPATATRYGFDYKGDGADRGFDMDLKNYGRGGKHVCLTRFDHEQISRFTNDELAELIDPTVEKDSNYDPRLSNGWCRMLMGIMDELDACLTEKVATEQGMYYEVDWLARELGLFD